jgi:broad specificity phosphatase PhoE
MSQTFYLVRHGQKYDQMGDPSLTEKGQEQAKKTAVYLKQFPIQKVIASPLLRAQQTAQIIASEFQLPVETDPLLKERMNWGDLPNQTFVSFLKEWAKTTHNREFDPKNGDSSKATGERVEKVIQDLNKENDKHVVLVTHGGTIADFLRNIFGDQKLKSIVQYFGPVTDFKVTECSITIVEKKDHDFELKALTYHQHL